MKKIFTLLLFGLLAASSAFSQTAMTEEQIIRYVQQQHEKGKSNSEIGAELVKMGVTPEQLKSIKARYEREGTGGSVDLMGGASGKNLSEERMRDRTGVNQRSSSKAALDRMSKQRRQQYDDGLAGDYSTQISSMFPDSMQMLLGDEMYSLPQPAEGETQSRIFGHDIFNNTMLTFEPNENVATPGNYRITAGDKVFIDIWGASQATYSDTVSPDGTIVVEGVGPITLAGMTVDQANASLGRTFQNIYANSNVRLTVGQTHTIGVNVMGEVVAPGTYTISAFATVFHALYAAGGINDIGTLRGIMVYRKGRKVAEVDVYDYILHGKTMDDIQLEANDVVYVGSYQNLVDIAGKVKRPMIYEMKSNESLATLLGFAGSFAGDAYRRNVRVIRKNGYDYTVHTVEEFDYASFKVLDGDSVTVDSTVMRYSNMVELRGAVYRPGMYQMDGKTKTVRELLQSTGGYTEEAVRTRAVIYRMKDDRSREVRSFNLEALMSGEASDIPLQNEDVVHVFSQEDARLSRTLTIYGAVCYPGKYDFSDNCTIEDLILQAGGLTDNASLQNVEVSRRLRDTKAVEQGNVTSEIFAFTLSPDLNVNDGTGFVLQPYDEVYVRSSPVWVDSRTVAVSGEANFEGSYALQRKDERLSDIVKRAGGLTEYAYIEGAHLERTMSEDELDRKKALIRLSQSAMDSTDLSVLDISNIYTVGINLRSALENPGGVDDIVLSAGDRLVIPEHQSIVKVNGAVMSPNAVAWQKGKSAKYYIDMAGGYSVTARRRRAFVVSMNGTVKRASKVKRVAPGSEIVVPAKPNRARMSTPELVALCSASASIATVIISMVNVLKK